MLPHRMANRHGTKDSRRGPRPAHQMLKDNSRRLAITPSRRSWTTYIHRFLHLDCGICTHDPFGRANRHRCGRSRSPFCADLLPKAVCCDRSGRWIAEFKALIGSKVTDISWITRIRLRTKPVVHHRGSLNSMPQGHYLGTSAAKHSRGYVIERNPAVEYPASRF